MIKTYLKDGKKLYEVFVKTVDQRGKQVARRKRGISSERKAKEMEFQIKKELEILTTGERPWTFSEWLDECLRRMQYSLKQSTIINYRGRLDKWLPQDFKDKELQNFTKNDIFQFIFEHLDQEMSDYSKRNIFKMVRRIFEMAVEDNLIASNPTKGLKVKVFMKEQKVLTSSEVEVFLNSAKLIQHRFYPIWVIALLTGMRSGEMYALKWSDIDFESKTLSVNKQWTSKNGFGPTKTKESRIVPLSPELAAFLKEIRLSRPSDSSSEFVLPHLQEWTHGEQSKVTREFCRSLGITEIKFHDLRATFITNMLAQGAPLVTVMAIVGHKRMSTTDVYLRLAGLNLKGATDQLGYKIPHDESGQILSFPNAKNSL